MDKKNLLAVGLITLIITVWMIYMSVNQAPPPPPPPEKPVVAKNAVADTNTSVSKATTESEQKQDSVETSDKFGGSFEKLATGTERIITIDNGLVVAQLSTRGGTIKHWNLTKFKSWNNYQTDLIWTQMGELVIKFNSRETGREVNTRDLYYEIVGNVKDNYTLKGNDSLSITFKLEPQKGKTIIRTYTFYADKYHINTDITVNNLEDIFTNKGYKLEWGNGLRYQEGNSVDESTDAEGIVSLNGEVFTLKASDYNPVQEQKTGIVDFIAVKTKYFTSAIIPKPARSFDGIATLNGQKYGAPDEGAYEKYKMSLTMPYRGGEQTRSFQIFIGPIAYDIVHEYGLQAIVNFGWKWIVRPIGEFFMLPFFMLIYKFIGNFGISIIVFSIFMKIILHPLSITQMRSAQKMQVIAPVIADVREKYKDDSTKQNQEVMKIYSEYGINPAGGCLPLILQMPILYALWAVLRTAIDLRQAPFAFWIHDLSLPDSILTLPFPIIGISHISGLALAMGITMFFQQKMTVTDPKQKAMVYMMPVMFTLMFSNFPSGLNLYYFMFNVLSIGQQVYINKYSKNKMTLDQMKRAPKKEGWLAKKMREAQDIAGKQGKSVPGAPRQTPQKGKTQSKKK
jgi:YidC/Oxa1 family membrane protein insertase